MVLVRGMTEMVELIVFVGMCVVIAVFGIKMRRLAGERRGTGRLRERGSTTFYMIDRGGVYGPKYPEEGTRAMREKQERERRGE